MSSLPQAHTSLEKTSTSGFRLWRGSIKSIKFSPILAHSPTAIRDSPIVIPRRDDIILITLSVNGSARNVDTGSNVTRLLEALELGGKRVAVERNGEIVPRSQYGDTPLAEGDQLEIVVAVGGG